MPVPVLHGGRKWDDALCRLLKGAAHKDEEAEDENKDKLKLLVFFKAVTKQKYVVETVNRAAQLKSAGWIAVWKWFVSHSSQLVFLASVSFPSIAST